MAVADAADDDGFPCSFGVLQFRLIPIRLKGVF